MQRKLEIIRSLIHTPDVLFLDEPTQGLDAVSRRSLWEYIDDTRKRYGTTIFLTTHYIDEAENVDKVCIINHGKIAVCASPDEMKRTVNFDPTPRVCLPSLEDAYVEFLKRGEAA
jgi:ABC-2 type transport system ATP-binding protein